MTVLQNASGKLVSTGSRSLSFPSRATSPAFYGANGGGSVGLSGGLTVSYAQLYRSQPWLYIGVNKISRIIAGLPLLVKRQLSEGKETVTSGPLVDLLSKPWPGGSSLDLKQAFTLPTLIQGNSVVVKVRKRRGAPPTSVNPLLWQMLTPGIDPTTGKVIYWQSNGGTEAQFYDPADVIHTAWQSPDIGLGVSPFQVLGTTIAAEDAAQRYSEGSFSRGIRPSGALVTSPDSKMSVAEAKEYQQMVEEEHSGVDSAFDILVLGGGFDWKPFAQTAKEAQLIEYRKLTREEVAAVFDIPPPMIGILDNATFSNVEQQHQMLYTDVLSPWLSLIQEKIQAQLIDTEPAFEGLSVEFDLNERLKGDPEKRINAYAKGVESGIYTRNEAREREGLTRDPDPNANKLMIQQNNVGPISDATGAEESKARALDHLVRVRDRTLSRIGAESDDGFEQDRFARELVEDGGDPDAAATLAEIVATGIADAHGDPDRIKKFFSALGA